MWVHMSLVENNTAYPGLLIVLFLSSFPFPVKADQDLHKYKILKEFPLQDSKFTVTWWKKASPGERDGFLERTMDCMQYVLHVRFNLDDRNDIDRFDRVDASLMRNGHEDGSAGTLIEQVMAGKDKSKAGRTAYEGGWGPGGDSWRRGFVEGYTTCNERHGKKLWYNPVEYYVYVLNMMYDPDQRYGDDQFDGPVSDVLDKFGYPPPAPSWTAGGLNHFIPVPVYPEIPLN